MKKSKFISVFQVLFLILFFSGCNNKTATIPQVEQGNFILYVSNQSSDLDPVDINIFIDGKLAVNQDFLKEDGHNWIKFEFQLKDGSHKLFSSSSKGNITQDTSFVLPATPYSIIDFLYSPDSSGIIEIKEFSIYFSKSPPGFM